MKIFALILTSIFLSLQVNAQDYKTKEIICPSLLEFKLPESFSETGFLQKYGGLAVLKLQEANIRTNRLVCTYEDKFSSSGFDGFGFVFSGDKKNVPYDIILTVDDTYLQDWGFSRKTVKCKNYYRDYVVYTLEREPGEAMYSWHGAFYNLKYEGKAIEIAYKFDGYAIPNQNGNGAIISKTKQNLYTPAVNQNIDLNQNKKLRRKIKK